MNYTAQQWSLYSILLSMNNNGPLTDDKRNLFMSVDLTPFGITEDDKKTAVRWYESTRGLILTQGVC